MLKSSTKENKANNANISYLIDELEMNNDNETIGNNELFNDVNLNLNMNFSDPIPHSHSCFSASGALLAIAKSQELYVT